MDDTYLNPGDKQIALYVIKAFVENYDNSAKDQRMSMLIDMGRGLLEKHHILTEDEYKER